MSAKPRTSLTATDPGEVVVFLIGMTFNRPWKVGSWGPVFLAMPRMLRELAIDPELGLLSSRTVFGLHGVTVIQYWRSVEQLEGYARARDHAHMPAWAKLMKSKAATNGDVGIWHETFVTQPGQRESLYLSTPRFGFAKAAASLEPVGDAMKTAKKRRASGAPEAGPAELSARRL